jgi:hypothetical protein
MYVFKYIYMYVLYVGAVLLSTVLQYGMRDIQLLYVLLVPLKKMRHDMMRRRPALHCTALHCTSIISQETDHGENE